MESTKIIFEKIGENNSAKKNIINRSEKNILLVGGTLDEVNEFAQLGYGPPEINIITLNIDPKENPSIIGSIKTKNILPPKYFDIIYFSAVPANDINMEKAFNTASSALKDDGVLFFKGQAKILDFTNNKNTLLTADNSEIDIVSLLKNEKFSFIKKLRFFDGSFSQSEVVAAKVSSFDLVETCSKFPVIKHILLDCTGVKYDDNNLLYVLQNKEDELIAKLIAHLKSKENENSLEEKQKINVLSAAIHVLQGNLNMTQIEAILAENPKYKEGFFSQTEVLIQELIDLKKPAISSVEDNSNKCSIQ